MISSAIQYFRWIQKRRVKLAGYLANQNHNRISGRSSVPDRYCCIRDGQGHDRLQTASMSVRQSDQVYLAVQSLISTHTSAHRQQSSSSLSSSGHTQHVAQSINQSINQSTRPNIEDVLHSVAACKSTVTWLLVCGLIPPEAQDTIVCHSATRHTFNTLTSFYSVCSSVDISL